MAPRAWSFEYSRCQFRVFGRKTHLFETVNRKKNWSGILESFYSVNRRINGDKIVLRGKTVVLSSGKTVWRTDWTFERRTSKGMFKRFYEFNSQIITGLIVDLYWNAFLIDRFFVFRTVIAKCFKNPFRSARWIDSKIDLQFLQIACVAIASQRKLYAFAS